MKLTHTLCAPLLVAGLCAACGTQTTASQGDTTPSSATEDPVASSSSANDSSSAMAAESGDSNPSEAESADEYEGQAPLETMTGKATYYGDGLAGKPTASGETFDPQAKTAAMFDMPMGTIVRVTRLDDENQSVTVRINDRMAELDEKIIDLTVGAAQSIDLGPDQGVADVRVEVLEKGESGDASQ